MVTAWKGFSGGKRGHEPGAGAPLSLRRAGAGCTGQGWNIGKTPYGYAADKVEHPVPGEAAEGQTKTRLVPDPQQAPVVAYICRLRFVERLGYDAIAACLNIDSAVRNVLHNPKYTGYMV
jgi:hypothetical protein